MGKRNPMPKRVYAAVVARAEDIFPWPCCEAVTPVCSSMGGQWHHRQLRSQGGEHVVENGLFVCHDCHDYIHGHPAESYRNGWLVHGWDNPEKTPVMRRGERVQLMENGTVIKCKEDKDGSLGP